MRFQYRVKQLLDYLRPKLQKVLLKDSEKALEHVIEKDKNPLLRGFSGETQRLIWSGWKNTGH